jgi:pimeloyl-ACP methyl ester carboxylesterase
MRKALLLVLASNLSWTGWIVCALQSRYLTRERQSRRVELISCAHSAKSAVSCPPVSPVTGLENRFYTWRHGQRIRYQCTHASGGNAGPPVLLIHGLFVNSDHWRKTLEALKSAGYAAYAMDLFGCGYSDKPPADSQVAQLCNGEAARFQPLENDGVLSGDGRTVNKDNLELQPRVLRNVMLGTANGRDTRTVDIELCHPLGSPYNFYTWADQVTDFCRDVILPNYSSSNGPRVSLVANSIGSMVALQAIIDQPELYTGAFIVCPNFRELHSAEIPLASVTMPLVRRIQRLLREQGQGLFDFLATPAIVKSILQEPYHVTSAVDDDLVQVLLDPLLTPGASQVVFDTLSYSAGPLPEQQLQQFPSQRPVWVCYGDQDPWTPGPRVERLIQYEPVAQVVRLSGAGHCPHDETPELVNPLLIDFLSSVTERPRDNDESTVDATETPVASESTPSV